jgi:hypothetical protein
VFGRLVRLSDRSGHHAGPPRAGSNAAYSVIVSHEATVG